MEMIGRALVAIVVMALAAATFPSVAAANVESFAPAPSPASDGTTIDQGIAYVLMLLALVLTYIIH
ncbi:hypothetical protein CDL12_00102 [Handroanthus impetiginosus]|uniref:Arabinogalactan peptide n=1 Tax=Handroanthus impetiginosus TaxID=429701 RepID=A0A2G9IBT1_9LAMI|nr:hypothetical protein CDL12_00102 [Handroanthus impetiginosus]